MKKYTLILLVSFALTSCFGPKLTKKEAYPKMYEEKPLTVLIMPPINKSTHAEAKEWFITTFSQPLSYYGYYIFPTIITTEVLKNEGAYDTEMFIGGPVNKFGEIFGADAVLFTTINKWDKNAVMAKITVNVEYELKSTKSNEVLWSKKGEMKVDTSMDTGIGGIWGMAADVVASAIKTAATDYVPIARQVNYIAITDIPYAKYHDKYQVDTEEISTGPVLKYRKVKSTWY